MDMCGENEKESEQPSEVEMENSKQIHLICSRIPLGIFTESSMYAIFTI